MNTRIVNKHVTQYQRPFHNGLVHYAAKVKKCKRWRNRRKAHRYVIKMQFKKLLKWRH